MRAAEATGSVAVTAGAGTGKTKMLAARYLYHVRTDGFSPLAVVAVTFTDKAADELRSRIRKTLFEQLGDEKIIAEVEAAQISTMHALAARICRDFYDLAGIPADFTVLDDTENPLWIAEKFEEAIAELDPAVFDELGFTWLTSAISILLKDPYSSEKALSLGADQWSEAIDQASETAIVALTCSEIWSDAVSAVNACRGKAGDKLEDVRSDVMPLLIDRPNIEMLAAALKSFARNKGAAANWPTGELERLRFCLGDLKDAVKVAYEFATLRFGPEDEEAARRIKPLAAAFRQVREKIAAEKLRDKVLDFGDLEHYALEILKQPGAIEHYQLRWKAFLVDEFQDTNPIQAEILRRLTQGARLTIVGDEKQSIYGFRGADVGVFSRVRGEIVGDRKGEEIPLSKTFRTHHELVEKMNAVFAPVMGELHQSLEAHRNETKYTAPHIHSAVVAAEKGALKPKLQIIEARYIAQQIKVLHDDAKVPYHDIAIIARTWAPLDVYLDVLSAMKIPAVNAGGGSLLATREARDVYALLCFLTEPNDDIPLVALLRGPFFAISDVVLFDASRFKAKDNSWWNVIAERPEFSPAVAVLRDLLDDAPTHSAGQIVHLADKLTGYGAVIANMPHGSRRVADLRGIYEMLRKLERQGRGDIFGTTRYIRELMETETEIPRPPLDVGEAVSLMTIHKSKGLEWPVVFIPDLARDRRSDSSPILIDPEIGVAFQMESDGYEKTEPSIHKLIKLRRREREINETRRLYYVAITRAKDKVVLTATKDKGFAIDILRPGLDAAGITDDIIPYDDDLAIAPSPGEREPFATPEHINVEPVTIGLRSLSVTALTTYAKCPLRFKYEHVDGHLGLREVGASAMSIGSLTHLALELGIDNVDALRCESPDDPDEHLAEAISLAARYRSHPAYEAVRSAANIAEHKFVTKLGGIELTGVADIVGDNFVVDYKTDSEMHPDEHRFQLWAYAAALDKPTAYLAYLRHDTLHGFSREDLDAIAVEAISILDGISRGDHAPKPSAAACGYCPYKMICKDCAASN
ncbi:hypothetical protein BH10ACI3_BH10ACI3_10170 [soil metagenome]